MTVLAWRRVLWGVGFASSAWVLIHCGSDTGDSVFTDPKCAALQGSACGAACKTDKECVGSLYCGASGHCTADCTPGASGQCGLGECSSRGRCEPPPAFDGSTGQDGTIDDGGFGGDGCASTDVNLTKVKPTVLLLVDQSSSMSYYKFPAAVANELATPYNGPNSRWMVLKDALIGPTGTPGGLVKEFEADVAFGLQMYSARSVGPDSDKNSVANGVCPRFNDVAFAGNSFAFNAFAGIDSVYRPASTIDDTPTSEALLAVVGIDQAGAITNAQGFASYVAPGPKIVVLATDGEPAVCSRINDTGTNEARLKVVAAAQATYSKGIKTFVVAVGADINVDHQKNVANAGQGLDPVSGAAKIYRPNSIADLRDSFREIIYGARTCVFKLDGSIRAGTESRGLVTLNGAPLGYNDPNGWKVNNPAEIEITGTSCDMIKNSDAKVSVRFPCGTIIPGVN